MREHAMSQLMRAAVACLVLWSATAIAQMQAPTAVEAGQPFRISTDGTGDATFYLLGPNRAMKQAIRLGREIEIAGDDVRAAGEYRAVICSSQGCDSRSIMLHAGSPARISFFLHPSRVPVSAPDSIDATAFVFDRYHNPVLIPTKIDFQIAPATGASFARSVNSEQGVAWLRLSSTDREGPVRIAAATSGVKEVRVIQQVSAEACALRMKAAPDGKRVLLETDPVRDCRGNPLPDGTIVSFTTIDAAGKSTVDTPIRKGIARTQVPVKGRAQISVACGVVLGNELSVEGNL